jgi:hypothetical protein
MEIFRMRRSSLSLLMGIACSSMTSIASADAGGWHYGVGTGFSSFSVNGDVGVPVTVKGNVPAGAVPPTGIVADVDLNNKETSDLLDSAVGLTAFAANEDWSLTASFNKLSLKDQDSRFDAEWDKTQAEFIVAYNFARVSCNTFALQLGARYVEHDWSADVGRIPVTGGTVRMSSDVDDHWTDVVVGIMHTRPLAKGWVWRNVANYGLGGSEGTVLAQTSVIWKPLEHWAFNASARYLSTEYGDKGDLGDSDFYYYKADEPAVGLGVNFVW